MQTIVIAALIVIAGLIGALVFCATNLINRARAANTTLRRIEETLLSINRSKVLEAAAGSAVPATQVPPADSVGAGFLTIRELKKMSAEDRARRSGATNSSGHRSPRNTTDPGMAPDLEATPAIDNTEVAEHADIAPSPAVFTNHAPDESEINKWLESSFAISWPRTPQAAADTNVQMSFDEVIVPARDLSTQTVSEIVEDVPVAINPEILKVPEPLAITPSNANLDEIRRKKKEQELLIISSRRRRARAGR